MKVKADHEKLIIQTRDRIYLILYNDILYIERFNKKSIIQTRKREIPLHLSLKKISENLPFNFVRTHQSYIINKTFVTELNSLNSTLYEATFTEDKIALVKKEYLNLIFQ
jgi:DNA-binding LytR/AlgR family response regulator